MLWLRLATRLRSVFPWFCQVILKFDRYWGSSTLPLFCVTLYNTLDLVMHTKSVITPTLRVRIPASSSFPLPTAHLTYKRYPMPIRWDICRCVLSLPLLHHPPSPPTFHPANRPPVQPVSIISAYSTDWPWSIAVGRSMEFDTSSILGVETTTFIVSH